MKTNERLTRLRGFRALGMLVLFFGISGAAGAVVANGAPDSNAPDLAAIHNAASRSFNKNCLGCHAAVVKERSLDRNIKGGHAAMLPFAPGYDAKKGAGNAVCVSCHENVDVLQHSAAQIRRNVSVDVCAACHGKSGLASRKFYAN